MLWAMDLSVQSFILMLLDLASIMAISILVNFWNRSIQRLACLAVIRFLIHSMVIKQSEQPLNYLLRHPLMNLSIQSLETFPSLLPITRRLLTPLPGMTSFHLNMVLI